MKQSLLLFLSADRIHAQIMSGGVIQSQNDFHNDPTGHDGFSSFLQGINYPAYLLVDLIEEDFRHDVVPHLVGKSRSALFQRKFEQFYRGTTFHQATLLRRQKSGRRDDEMLFSALTNPSLITPWLSILQSRHTPLAGIYSVPQISAPLIKDHPSKHLLLISWEKDSGLRQSYFNEHRLQISRLTPIHAEQTFNSAVIRELGRTYQYLKSLSLLPVGQVLDVRILCHSRDMDELKAHLPSNTDMQYDFADIEQVGKQLKIKHQFTDSDASQIFIHQLLASRPKSHYASTEHSRYFIIWQLRILTNWLAGILLISSTLWSITTVLQSGGNESETATLKIQTQRTLKEVEQITQSLPAHSVAPSDMKAAVEVMRRLESLQPDPKSLLAPLSKVMDRFEQVRIVDIEWKSSFEEPIYENTSGEFPAQVIVLKGELLHFESGFRAALAYLDRFKSDLTNAGYHTEVLTLPLDISPDSSLANQNLAKENKLEFSLKLVWRPPL